MEEATISTRATVVDREREVDSRGDKMQISVMLGYIFLKEQGHDEAKITESFCFAILVHHNGGVVNVSSGAVDGSLRDNHRLRKTVVKLENRPEEMAEGHGRGSRWHELGENKCEEAWRHQGLVADTVGQKGQLWPFLLLAVGSGILVTKIGKARKLVKGVA